MCTFVLNTTGNNTQKTDRRGVMVALITKHNLLPKLVIQFFYRIPACFYAENSIQYTFIQHVTYDVFMRLWLCNGYGSMLKWVRHTSDTNQNSDITFSFAIRNKQPSFNNLSFYSGTKIKYNLQSYFNFL